MSRGLSCFGINIARNRSTVVSLAIFSGHSTRFIGSTIIVARVIAHRREHVRQEISAMQRREFLNSSLVPLPSAALSSRAARKAGVKEIRIGYQKNGVLVIARQQASLENHFSRKASR